MAGRALVARMADETAPKLDPGGLLVSGRTERERVARRRLLVAGLARIGVVADGAPRAIAERFAAMGRSPPQDGVVGGAARPMAIAAGIRAVADGAQAAARLRRPAVARRPCEPVRRRAHGPADDGVAEIAGSPLAAVAGEADLHRRKMIRGGRGVIAPMAAFAGERVVIGVIEDDLARCVGRVRGIESLSAARREVDAAREARGCEDAAGGDEPLRNSLRHPAPGVGIGSPPRDTGRIRRPALQSSSLSARNPRNGR